MGCSVQFSSVQSFSRVRLFPTPWIVARQASLSISNSQSSLRHTSIESVMPSRHLILSSPSPPAPIPPSIRVFSNESTLSYQLGNPGCRVDHCPNITDVYNTAKLLWSMVLTDYIILLIPCDYILAPHSQKPLGNKDWDWYKQDHIPVFKRPTIYQK